MYRRLGFLAVLVVVLGSGPRARAQPRPAPFYSLPEDGVWVEYAWQAAGRDGKKESGLLRLSSVGRQEVHGVACRWIEIAKQAKEPGQSQPRLRKVLVDEKKFKQTQSLPDCTVEAFEQSGPRAEVIRLTAPRLDAFLRMNLRDSDGQLKEMSAREEIQFGQSKCVARHVAGQGRTNGRALRYDGWLTDEVAFGWAKFEIHEQNGIGPPRLVFSASATKSGKGAKGELKLINRDR